MSHASRPTRLVLTQRDRAILKLMAEGYRPQAIGEQLGLRRTAIEAILQAARRRNGMANNVQLAVHMVRGAPSPSHPE